MPQRLAIELVWIVACVIAMRALRVCGVRPWLGLVAFAVMLFVVVQLLWLLGVLDWFPGSTEFRSLNIWLAIIDAAIIPMAVALAGFAIGKRTVPIASAIGLLAFVQLLLVSGIVRVTGLA